MRRNIFGRWFVAVDFGWAFLIGALVTNDEDGLHIIFGLGPLAFGVGRRDALHKEAVL